MCTTTLYPKEHRTVYLIFADSCAPARIQTVKYIQTVPVLIKKKNQQTNTYVSFPCDHVVCRPFNADLPEAAGHFNYHTYCSGVMQTELDVLTGEYAISRVDIMFDCGERWVTTPAPCMSTSCVVRCKSLHHCLVVRCHFTSTRNWVLKQAPCRVAWGESLHHHHDLCSKRRVLALTL